MNPEVENLIARIDAIQGQLRPVLSKLAKARHRHFQEGTAASRHALEVTQKEATELHEASKHLVAQLPGASGLPLELFEAVIAEEPTVGPSRDQLPRLNLTEDQVATTLDMDELLPDAIEHIERLLPHKWLAEQDFSEIRLCSLREPDAFLSLTRNIRIRSERTAVHRLRQIIGVSKDYLTGHPLFDHFAGAQAIPYVVQLFRMAEHLHNVGGEKEERLAHLWKGPSEQVDSTLFELFTAAACAEKGRDVEFLTATHEKTPDIRSHDPYPLVVECKRQEIIAGYEVTEDNLMRALFGKLRVAARSKGLAGTFRVSLSVEAGAVDLDDVVAKLVSQRLAPIPQRAISYPWGDTSFSPLTNRVYLPEPTRRYSPYMLEYLFDWTSDLPEWDGLCCSITDDGGPLVDSVQGPIGLVWRNTAANAVRKRTWAPTNLFAKAIDQVPAGEFGIVYVSYVEGARAEVADVRLRSYFERINQWSHSAKIRIPITVLSRVYPRALEHGRPDLIESGVRYVSAEDEDYALLFDLFPTTIFTKSD